MSTVPLKYRVREVTHASLARIWLIARALRERRPDQIVNASTLAREMEVSTKTIHRDIDFLRDRLQHSIEYVPGKHTYRYTCVPMVTYL